MAIHAIDVGAEDWYVPESDPDRAPDLETCRENGATIFFFKPIPNKVITDIQDEQNGNTLRAIDGGTSIEQVVNQRNARRNRDCFRFAITRIENFSTRAGVPLTVDFGKQSKLQTVYDVVSEETMNQIPPAIVGEVGREIFSRNTMTDTQRKKLEAALSELDGSKNGTADNAADKTSTSADASVTPGQETSKTSNEPAETQE